MKFEATLGLIPRIHLSGRTIEIVLFCEFHAGQAFPNERAYAIVTTGRRNVPEIPAGECVFG
jgi:hypothetical protein